MSDDVKRYMICGGGAHEASGGTWVSAHEYDRLRAELDEANDTVVKMVGREQDLRARIAEIEAWQKMVCELPTIEMAEARAVVSRALAALARLGGNDSTEHRLAKSASQHIDMALATQTRRLMSRIAELEAANDHAELSIDHLRTMLDAYRSVVTVSYDDECGEWTAEVVGLPGCIGAGDTAEEAVRTALWFAPGWIETMFERNRARIAELEARQPTEEQIDLGWGGPEALWIMENLPVIPCGECGGSKLVKSDTAPCHIDCPACHRNGKSHGWVFKPTNKEK